MSTLFVFLFFFNVCYGWLNFSYSPPRQLTPGIDFSFTVCIDTTYTYIHFDYLWRYDSKHILPNCCGKTPLIVAFGTTKPHIGGTNESPRRYGNDDPLGSGANAIIFGNDASTNPGVSSTYTKIFEQELNDLVNTGWWGTPLKECTGASTCSTLYQEIYNDTYAFITIKRINIPQNYIRSFIFNQNIPYILFQWAYTPYGNYWYGWEHAHQTRGSSINSFADQTIADYKYLNKTLLIDVDSGESSGISIAILMNRNTGMITVELWGPDDRWWGIAWGGHSQGDALIFTSGDSNSHTVPSLGLYDYAVWGFEIDGISDNEGIYPDNVGTSDYDQVTRYGNRDWYPYLTETFNNGEVYYKVEREMISTDIPTGNEVEKDVDFNFEDDSLILFVATSDTISTQFAYHDNNYWISKLDLIASGNIQQTQTWMEKQLNNGYNVNCDGDINTNSPSKSPTKIPTDIPSSSPITRAPIIGTYQPTNTPSYQPSLLPTTSIPTNNPIDPTLFPTYSPITEVPTISPTTREPTDIPTTSSPTNPTVSPSMQPTIIPITTQPTRQPIVTTESMGSDDDNFGTQKQEEFKDNIVFIYALIIVVVCLICYFIKKCIIGDKQICKKNKNNKNELSKQVELEMNEPINNNDIDNLNIIPSPDTLNQTNDNQNDGSYDDDGGYHQ